MEKQINSLLSFLCFTLLLSSCSSQTNETKSTDHALADSAPEIALDLKNLVAYQVGDTTISFSDGAFPDAALEPSRLKDDRVRRVGDSLVFNLAGGRPFVLVNRTGDEDGQGFENYTFVESLDQINQWLVFGSYYEAFDFIMVDQKDGLVNHLWGRPVLSPDKKYFVSGMQDLMAGFVPNGIQLWKIENQKPVKLWEQETENWGPDNFLWATNNTLFIQRSSQDSASESGELKQDIIRVNVVKN